MKNLLFRKKNKIILAGLFSLFVIVILSTNICTQNNNKIITEGLIPESELGEKTDTKPHKKINIWMEKIKKYKKQIIISSSILCISLALYLASRLSKNTNEKPSLLTYIKTMTKSPKKITCLNISELSGLDGAISSYKGLEQFINLKNLDLFNSKLKKIPEEIKNLTKLESINLSFNRLKDLPAWISDLKKIKTLFLSENLLAKVPQSIQSLTELIELDLSNNSLTSKDLDIDWPASLKILDLSENYFFFDRKGNKKKDKEQNKLIESLKNHLPKNCKISFSEDDFFDDTQMKKFKEASSSLNITITI